MLVEADRLATPLELRHKENIRGGIEFDRYGSPVAYYVLKQHPGDVLLGAGAAAALYDYERIPAFTAWGRRRVIHLHDKERTGQSRGKPVVSAIMRELHMAGKYATNELRASVANSLVAAFIQTDASVDHNAVAAAFGRTGSGSVSDAWRGFLQRRGDLGIRQADGASFVTLPPGASLNTFSPGRPNPSFEAFMLASLRNIAAGMNIPYELLVKDFSKSNYSSARAALLEAWRYFNGRRRWLTDYWLRPIYELWLEEAVNAGQVEAPGFYANRYAYSRARFIFGGRGWVDPVKDANAAQIRMQSGISTLERECAEQGEDYEEVLDQLAFEARRRGELGLPSQFQAAPAAPAAAAANTAAANPGGNPDGDEDDTP
jgi:lambda family phage portal protein